MGNGMGGPGYSFVDEFDPGLRHGVPGILSMANSGPNTNGSQFFITLVPTPHLDGRHAVFGVIVDGMDILQKIGSVPTRPGDKPVEPVTIKSITFVRVGDKAKAFDANATFGKGMEDAGKPDAAQEEKLKSRLRAMGVPEDGIITKGSGLRYFIKRPGTGKMPSRGDIIQAHYTGYLIDGKKFDSSYDRGTPFETPIGVKRVIAGWDEAFLGMREGEKRVLIIPFDLAYGAGGYPPVIPPRATLIFEVELIRVKPRQ
jgi:peptidylprolyl isomerase